MLGDGIPQGNPLAADPNGELLSPRNNPNFGQPAITTFLDQAWAYGWGQLPYDIQLAGTFQSQPGPERFGIVAIPAAEIEAALGRPQALPGAVTVNAVRPGTQYGERFNQFDLRLTKIFGVGGDTRLRAMVDLFNLFNANAVVKEQYGVGDDYLVPLGFMPGRLLKFTFQLDF